MHGVWVTRSGLKTLSGQCVTFLGKTLYSHSASLHPGIEMGTGELSVKLDEMLGGLGRREYCNGPASHPGNWDKLWLGGPLGLNTDLTLTLTSTFHHNSLWHPFFTLLVERAAVRVKLIIH